MVGSPAYGFGSGILYGLRTDIVAPTPTRFGVLQDVSLDFASDVKMLYGQNQYALDAARGKTKITGKAKYAIIQTSCYNNLYFGSSMSTGQSLFSYNEAATIGAVVPATTNGTTALGNPTLHFASVPAGVIVGASITDVTDGTAIPAGTYVLSKTSTTVTMSANATNSGVGATDVINFGPGVASANASNWTLDLGVYYAATGLPLTYVTGSPTTGQYSVTAGTYTFASAEAATGVLLNYNYSSSMTGDTIAGPNPLMGDTPVFSAVFQQRYKGHTLNMTLYQCVSNKLTIPTKLDDYLINEIDFECYANAAGNVFTMSMDN